MQPTDIVNQYYLKFGRDEVACAKEYLRNNTHRHENKEIKRIAIYYSMMKYGGVGRVISLMLPIYKYMGYEVILITEDMSDVDYYIPDSVKRYVVTRMDVIGEEAGLLFRKHVEEMAHILTQEKIDVLIHHKSQRPLFLYDIILAKLLGIYTVAERHQLFTEEFCSMHDLFPTQVETFKMLDKLIVLSKTDVLYWRSVGVDACYIENPFNISLSNLKHNPHNEDIVWIGRLAIVQKQYLDILDIAKEVIVRKPNARFLIYGNGADKEVELLNTEIKKRSLTENVFYCGYQTDISQIYENARIHLVTSAFEAFPMGIYESRICGIPLVMYELPYLELLKSGKGYLAADSGNIEAMADNICRILEDKELEKTLQTDAKESVKDFNNDIIYAKWKDLFSEIEQGKKDVTENKEFEIILRTMHKHFGIAQKRYNDLLCSLEDEKILFNVSKGVGSGKKLVLCPYGKVGKAVKRMINEKGIYETYIVDNVLSKEDPKIKSLNELESMDCSDIFFVICSSQIDIRQFFYKKCTELTSEDNVIFYNDDAMGPIHRKGCKNGY